MKYTKEEFERIMRNNHISLDSFIKVFNVWTSLSVQQRNELIREAVDTGVIETTR